MKPRSFMIVAGEASGDQLAAELVQALRQEMAGRIPGPTDDAQPLRTALAPRFFGAGGPRMAAAGVELAHDLTRHTVFGITGVIRHYLKFWRFRNELAALAARRQPDVVVGVDYSGFNRALASALRRLEAKQSPAFGNWHPKLVQFVSPQVWASRPQRAWAMARDYDLVLSIFPFEKPWYAERVPELRVEFVGHPIVDRFPRAGSQEAARADGAPAGRETGAPTAPARPAAEPLVLLLPGSRRAEVKRHWQLMLSTAALLAKACKVSFTAILPDEELARAARTPEALALAETLRQQGRSFEIQVGGLSGALATAGLAIASSGTVTLECAWFRVPTVVLYRMSILEHEIGKRIVTVPYIAMPNLLAGEEVFPEFIQDAANPRYLAGTALDLLTNVERRAALQAKLDSVAASLGPPGAAGRAAQAVLSLVD